MADPTWNGPQPPLGPPLQGGQTRPADPLHPVPGRARRIGFERHWHELNRDETGHLEPVAATVVGIDGIGGHIELGPWSMSPNAARLLSESLTALAKIAESPGLAKFMAIGGPGDDAA
jgi:hypothetical protein